MSLGGTFRSQTPAPLKWTAQAELDGAGLEHNQSICEEDRLKTGPSLQQAVNLCLSDNRKNTFRLSFPSVITLSNNPNEELKYKF
jgi:hypothetical protein